MSYKQFIPRSGELLGAVLTADTVGVVAGTLGGHPEQVGTRGIVYLIHYFGDAVVAFAGGCAFIEKRALDGI